MGRSTFSAFRRSSSVSAMIISLNFMIRFSLKNMCSVRQSPIPFALKSLATSASRGWSALARTLKSPICFSTISRNSKSPFFFQSGSISPTLPMKMVGAS